MLSPEAGCRLDHWKRHWATLLALLLLPLMISSQSFWIDELLITPYAKSSSSAEFMRRWILDRDSTVQMPGYFGIGTLLAQVIGVTEWQLRAQNLLWGGLAVVAMGWMGRRQGIVWLPLALAIHPYFWFYMNEARPYAMTIGCACWALAAALELMEGNSDPRKWAAVLLGSLWLMSTASMLNVMTGGVLTGAVTWSLWRQRKLARVPIGLIAIFVVLFAILGGYYIWTLSKGARGAKLWDVGLANLAMGLVEFSGMTGLLPGRVELRALARNQEWMRLLAAAVIPIATAAAWHGWVIWRGLRRRENLRYQLGRFVGGVAVASATLLIVALIIAGFPFWGRHLAAVFPFWILFIAVCWQCVWLRAGPAERSWLVLFPLCLIASFLMIRLASPHAKENYRDAATIARRESERGRVVWWSAAPLGTEYYGIRTRALEDAGPGVYPADQINPELAQTLPPPDVVVLSKPDLFDMTGAVRSEIKKTGLVCSERLQAFELYRRP
jgi:hypothetical protein